MLSRHCSKDSFEQVLRLSMDALLNVRQHFESLQEKKNLSQHLFRQRIQTETHFSRSTFSKVFELFQRLIQPAQECPALCHRVAVKQHLLRCSSEAHIMLQITLPHWITVHQAWEMSVARGAGAPPCDVTVCVSWSPQLVTPHPL